MTQLVRGVPLTKADLLDGSLVDLLMDPGKDAPMGSTEDPTSSVPEAVCGLDLSPAQRSAATEPLDLDALSGKDIFCELQLHDGHRVWLRPEELADSPYFERTASRGAVELVPSRGRERGVGDLAVRVLRVFKIDPLETAAKLTQAMLLQRLERKVRPGLFQVGRGPAELSAVETARLKGTAPCLLMLHGTFSSTLGSFGALHAANQGERWHRLAGAYGQRLLALEHRTLSESPLQNAIDLAGQLPGGLHLHLLSHSRGGLIGELLSRRHAAGPGFSANELALLDDVAPTLAAQARELDALLREKAFVVERFVRVACPARGTTLASDRGRRWLEVIVNALFKLLDKGAKAGVSALGLPGLVPIAETAVELLKLLTLETLEISEIPGLHAMDPASDFIRALINNEHARSADELAVIAGDTEGSGVFGRLKLFAFDTFFERDNDLVVDTPSMVGGAQRNEARRMLARSDEVNHLTYFRHPRTSDVITRSLLEADLKNVSELAPVVIEQGPMRTPVSRSSRPDQPIVFLLPGIMGSHLEVDNDQVWVDLWQLARGGFARLHADAANVMPAGLLRRHYQGLADALAADHEVLPFAYDWRLPINDAASKLNAAVRARLADAKSQKRSIRFVAHSMGGLVVRAMMLLKDSVWPELAALPDRRFVMLGTPNQGSHAISLLLTGEEKLAQMLAMADMKNSLREIVDVAAGFGGALDMAPESGERDYFSVEAWEYLATAKQQQKPWPLPKKAELDRARAFRETLRAQDLTGLGIHYVAGQAKDTPVSASVEGTRLRFRSTRQGDGRVPWASGIPSGVKAWYVPAKHGAIPAYKPLYPGLRDILAFGTTQQLQDVPPATRDLPGELHDYPAPRINYLPDGDDLMAAALDFDPEPEAHTPEPLPPIDVSVTWGNLRYAKDPVVVGHYVGDLIVSAEAVLDRFLDHALSRRLAVGRYPGDIGTALAIPNARGELPGAVIVGLGPVSSRLSRTDLTRAVQAGVSEWAARALESKQLDDPNGIADAGNASRGLAFVAIGSGLGGLPISEIGITIIEGVHRALELLRGQRSIDEIKRLGLTRITFLELYEERAHTLWHGLMRRAQDGLLPDCFRFDTQGGGVRAGEGGRRRLVLREDDSWWTPLKITQKGSRLLFENIGDRARAELRGAGTHASHIDELLSDAERHEVGDGSLSRALFEMMVPNDLKDSLPSGDRLRLLVDGKTARYPWELILAGQRLHAGATAGHTGSGNGVIRQFVTDRFRPTPRMARAPNVLIVGDPETQASFAPLPGALHEAEAVQSTLGELGFHVPPRVLRDARSILIELHARPYQIVHLAGHGIEDLRGWLEAELATLATAPDSQANALRKRALQRELDDLDEKDPISAMVIGPMKFLTYRNIEQMSDVPELVFINCCHLGKIPTSAAAQSGQQGATAAAFAQKFIEIGVRAVIAAGWPVDDAAACTFADAFYRALCRGQTFGEAVRDARQQTRADHPDSNTWAAYQCYGDPSFRPTSSDRQSTDWTTPKERFGSPRHLAWEGIQTASNLKALRAGVAIAETHGFDSDGELCSEIGDAFRGFEAFNEAIRWYKQALLAEKARMPVQGVERLLNVIVRNGQMRASEGKKTSPAWLQEVDAAIALLTLVNQRYPAQERFALIGSANKRKAIALTGKRRLTALDASATAYSAAADMAKASTNPYPFINAAVMLGAKAWTAGTSLKSDEIKAMLEAAKERVTKISPNDFWDYAAPGDLMLAQIFLTAASPTEANADFALRQFSAAFERDRSKGNLASVVDQVTVMIEVISQATSKKGDPAGLRKVLELAVARMVEVMSA